MAGDPGVDEDRNGGRAAAGPILVQVALGEVVGRIKLVEVALKWAWC